MNIFYFPVLFICLSGDCRFYQSQNYSFDEQECKQEVLERIQKAKEAGATTAEGVCVDVDLEKMKEYKQYRVQPARFAQ